MARELSKDPFFVELVAEGAIRPESCLGIGAGVRVDVKRVGEVKQNGSFLLEEWERKQVLIVERRKGRMALAAKLRREVLLVIGLMAKYALIVARPLQDC